MRDNKVLTALKGLIIGATMIVPGVSGGSMAMILGIYDRLLSAISFLHKNLKENLIFLLVFVGSAGIGMFLFTSPLSWLLKNYEMPTLYFFLGAVFGGIPLIEKQSKVRELSLQVVLYLLIGVGSVLLISSIPTGIFGTEEKSGLLYLFILFLAGLLSATALILPGISVSHFLLMLGLYEELLAAIKGFQLGFLIPLGCGILLGIVLFSKFLEYIMNRHPKPAYMIILGFILGSAGQIFPGIPKGIHILICALAAAGGFAAVYGISRMEMKN